MEHKSRQLRNSFFVHSTNDRALSSSAPTRCPSLMLKHRAPLALSAAVLAPLQKRTLPLVFQAMPRLRPRPARPPSLSPPTHERAAVLWKEESIGPVVADAAVAMVGTAAKAQMGAAATAVAAAGVDAAAGAVAAAAGAVAADEAAAPAAAVAAVAAEMAAAAPPTLSSLAHI